MLLVSVSCVTLIAYRYRDDIVVHREVCGRNLVVSVICDDGSHTAVEHYPTCRSVVARILT